MSNAEMGPMTLSPGEDWGRPGLLPTGAPVAHTDRELVRLLSEAPEVVALAGGGLCRTLGGRGDVEARLGEQTMLLDIDVATVVADGAFVGAFAGHAVARGRWWGGPTAVVMNAQWLGRWDMAPRAHPGDGRLDAISGELGVRQRLIARGLAKAGTHIPHPDLTQQRAEAFEFTFTTPRRLWLDGRRFGRCSSIKVEIVSTIAVAV